jgi:hypothetical protein
MREVSAAIDEGIGPYMESITPRYYVMLMTMSSAELGRAFKSAIRDALYEQACQDSTMFVVKAVRFVVRHYP